MPPAYVKPYVKRGKTDAADAEAVCEAVTRPTMRFVPVKSPEQQAALSMHRTRDLLVKQRTQLINMIRGLLAEFGVGIPKGLERGLLMARQIIDGKAPEVPIEAARIVTTLSQQALDIHVRLREIDRDLAVCLRGNDVARRLMTIPGIGPVGATALAASVTDPHQFRSGRQFAAWLGLTPLQKSSGGKERLGRISKMGDKYLRKLLIVGMTSLVRRAKYNPGKIDPRLADLLARKPTRVSFLAESSAALRAQGRLSDLARVLFAQGWAEMEVGDWTGAMREAEESVRLAEETGGLPWIAAATILKARLAGMQGNLEQSEAHAAHAESLALSIGAGFLLAMLQIARGISSIGAGRHWEAYEHLRRLFAPADPAFNSGLRILRARGFRGSGRIFRQCEGGP